MRQLKLDPNSAFKKSARVVGDDPDRIVAEATGLLDDPQRYRSMVSGRNPFGDGHAAGRIMDLVERELVGPAA